MEDFYRSFPIARLQKFHGMSIFPTCHILHIVQVSSVFKYQLLLNPYMFTFLPCHSWHVTILGFLMESTPTDPHLSCFFEKASTFQAGRWSLGAGDTWECHGGLLRILLELYGIIIHIIPIKTTMIWIGETDISWHYCPMFQGDRMRLLQWGNYICKNW